MQEKQVKEFESAIQVVPCPVHGYGYITVKQCQGCINFQGIQNLMEKGPITGRRVDQVLCLYPAKKPIERIVDLDGVTMADAVLCPEYKSLVYISECSECHLHRGMHVDKPSWLGRLWGRKPLAKVLCGKIAGRQCNYVTTGLKEA